MVLFYVFHNVYVKLCLYMYVIYTTTYELPLYNGSLTTGWSSDA